MKKLLTIDDLIKFCQDQEFTTFDSKEFGYQICIQTPAYFESADSEDDSMLMGNVRLLHSGLNRNHSCVTEEAARKCMSTIAYKPILANFTDVNGELDFTTHDFEFNDDGTITYYEKQVGCFTADEPYIEQDNEHEDRMYVYAKCAIPRQYTEAANIIERKGGTKLSAELIVNRMSYDSTQGCLLLQDIVLMGCTLLGVDPDTGKEINEGMENARLDIADFSAESNCSFSKDDLIEEITQAVMNRLDNHNNDQRKEECGLSDFKEEVVDVESVDNEIEDKAAEEETPEVVEEFETEEEAVVDNEEVSEEADGEKGDVVEEEEFEENTEEDGKKNFSINGMTFEISLSEIQNALFELVNNTYAESDNDYYMVEVYEGSKTVVMTGIFTGHSFRQNYKVRNGVYSLTGDRVSVKAVYVTPDEESELDKMRSNYSAISEKLAKYESEPEKMSILNSNDYIGISDENDFKEFKKQENHFDMTVDDVKSKADAMLLQYAKSGRLNFAKSEEPKEEKKKNDFFAFARIEPNYSFLDELLKK